MAQSWDLLAIGYARSGRPEVAEIWYRKAIEVGRKTDDLTRVSGSLFNLAVLLVQQPERIVEAREVAEEALVIKKSLDPNASQIWRVYELLARIAEMESRHEDAADYRRQARQAKRHFAGTRHELRRHYPVMVATVLAVAAPEHRPALNELLVDLEGHGWTNLARTIQEILAGQRDFNVLCADLDLEDTMIVETILQAIDDPTTLDDLQPDDLIEP